MTLDSRMPIVIKRYLVRTNLHRAALLLATLLAAPCAYAQIAGDLDAYDNFGNALATGDFDGNGFDDLAVGVSGEDVGIGPTIDAGAVNVIYGTSSGLATAGNQFLTQPVLPETDGPESLEYFGHSVASGDFNGDGFDDLAVGVPSEIIGDITAGAVNVFYGTSDGLTTLGAQEFLQPHLLPDDPEDYEFFGWEMTSGDFDGDGYDDLAVSVPLEDIGAGDDEGVVNVFYGTPDGLTTAGAQVFVQPAFPAGPEPNDLFGWAIVAGNFDGDAYDDLAVGVPKEDINDGMTVDVGAVNVFYGTAVGLTTAGAQVFLQPALPYGPEADDLFGSSLGAGDFNGDGHDDLAVGVPGEDNVLVDTGVVNVFYGTFGGLATDGARVFVDTAGSEAGDQFGWRLTTGHFNNDGYDDLIASVPYQDIGLTINAGAANVLFGSFSGLSAAGSQQGSQNSSGIRDLSEEGDTFGSAVAAGDFDGNGYDDLAIGVFAEDITVDDSTVNDAGAVNVIYGGPAGLPMVAVPSTAIGDDFWYQGGTGLDAPDGEDDEPLALAAGSEDPAAFVQTQR